MEVKSNHGKRDASGSKKKLDNSFDIDLNKSNLISNIQMKGTP
jgi:hypothetical protein